jgi:hypothetical protein
MNTNQWTNLISTLLQALSGFAVAQGYLSKSEEETMLALGSSLVVFFVSHFIHDDTTPPTPSKTALLLALLLPALIFTGCASAPANAYKAEGSAQITIDAAMTAWGDYVAANHPSAAVELQVRSAFEKYQQAELLAIDITAAYSSVALTNAPQATKNLTVASQNVANALSDLVALLQSFGVSL